MKHVFRRHQPRPAIPAIVKAGLGGALAILAVSALSHLTGNPWIMAPFGATCVLLFSAPTSPLSQPANVIGGHVLAALIGFAVMALLPVTWWSIAIAVGLSIAVMAALRITHPPAGATPLVVMTTAPGLDFVLFPTLLGSITLVAIAMLFHRLPPVTSYPLPAPLPDPAPAAVAVTATAKD